ncbi:hypothetical protein IMZ48_34800 [Candidatus Bathyarchaeota archaeon]|nr:hypothetical protein [Candidatus Bathyarchaeota archaeon]
MRLSTVLPLAAAPYALAGNLRRTGHAAAPVEAPAHVAAPAAAPAEHVAAPAEHVAAPAAAPAEHVAAPAEHVASPAEAPAAVPGHAGLVSSVDAIVIWVNAGAGAEKEVIQEHAAPPTVTHEVVVGGEQGLSYFPQEVAAQVGDMVVFTFYAMNHTVTQSTFDTPCSAMEGGMDSGFMANPDNSIDPAPQVAMQVMSESPIWMYCKQGTGPTS